MLQSLNNKHINKLTVLLINGFE